MTYGKRLSGVCCADWTSFLIGEKNFFEHQRRRRGEEAARPRAPPRGRHAPGGTARRAVYPPTARGGPARAPPKDRHAQSRRTAGGGTRAQTGEAPTANARGRGTAGRRRRGARGRRAAEDGEAARRAAKRPEGRAATALAPGRGPGRSREEGPRAERNGSPVPHGRGDHDERLPSCPQGPFPTRSARPASERSERAAPEELSGTTGEHTKSKSRGLRKQANSQATQAQRRRGPKNSPSRRRPTRAHETPKTGQASGKVSTPKTSRKRTTNQKIIIGIKNINISDHKKHLQKNDGAGPHGGGRAPWCHSGHRREPKARPAKPPPQADMCLAFCDRRCFIDDMHRSPTPKRDGGGRPWATEKAPRFLPESLCLMLRGE